MHSASEVGTRLGPGTAGQVAREVARLLGAHHGRQLRLEVPHREGRQGRRLQAFASEFDQCLVDPLLQVGYEA